MPPVYLVDSSIYIFRAWFSMPDTLVGADGRPVNAFYGFFDFVVRFLGQIRPRHVVFVFDESLEQSHRNDIYPAYKANRDPAPPELKRQFGQCRELVRSFGVSEISDNRYEGDDLIGTLAARARREGRPVVIVTSDKDLAQLVEDDDVWWDFTKGAKLDKDGVTKRFGVSPERIPDMLAIAGDAVDNIPGVPGVGPVTATHLLAHFDSLDELLERWREIENLKLRGAKRIAGLIGEHLETIRLSRRLTEIHCEVPLPDGFTVELGPSDVARFDTLSDDVGLSGYRRRQFAQCVERIKPE